MKLVALIKNVPDTEAKIQINADGSDIVTQGVKFVMNPYDEYAVEQALLIKESLKDDSTVPSYRWDRTAWSSRCGRHWRWAPTKRFT